MKIIRRFVFTAVFLVAAFLMVQAARANSDFFYMLYPAIMREVQGVLSALTQELDYVLWQRVLLVAAIWAVISLIVDIILQENLLRWVSGVTMLASFALCLYVVMGGLNVYAPSVAQDMRLSTNSDYTVQQLQLAAEYYRDQANAYADQVTRTADGLCAGEEFDVLTGEVASGLHNMTRESYVFGGTPGAIKQMPWKKLISASGVVMPVTGEICVDETLEPAALPFFMTRETARQLSIARNDDASFVAILACMASDSPLFRYSGSLMGYRLCMRTLEELDSTAAYKVASGAGEALQADVEVASFWPETTAGEKLMLRLNRGEEMQALPDVTELLVAWHIRLTTPEEDDEPQPEQTAAPVDPDAEQLPEAA